MQSASRIRLADFLSSCLMTSKAAAGSTQWNAAARALISAASQPVSWARSARFVGRGCRGVQHAGRELERGQVGLGQAAFPREELLDRHPMLDVGTWVVSSIGKLSGCIHPCPRHGVPSSHQRDVRRPSSAACRSISASLCSRRRHLKMAGKSVSSSANWYVPSGSRSSSRGSLMLCSSGVGRRPAGAGR